MAVLIYIQYIKHLERGTSPVTPHVGILAMVHCSSYWAASDDVLLGLSQRNVCRTQQAVHSLV
jgi:hypothetical protein